MRGEFSLVIIGLVGMASPDLGAVALPYVFILAIVGPLLARFAGSGVRLTPRSS